MLTSSYFSTGSTQSEAHFLYASQMLPQFSARKKHVLLVEDNPLLQHLHTLWLKQLSYDVTVVASGEAALSEVLSDYDLVLMDIDLPGDNGIVTTQKLLTQNPRLNLPFIACTSHPEADMKDACISAGMVGYLQKPISPALLAQSLTMYLD